MTSSLLNNINNLRLSAKLSIIVTVSLEIDWCIFDNFIEYQCFLSFRFYILQHSFVFVFASSCNAWIGKVKKYLSLLLAVYILRYFRLNEMFFRISPLYCIFNVKVLNVNKKVNLSKLCVHLEEKKYCLEQNLKNKF